MSQRRALDLIQALRQELSRNMSIGHAFNGEQGIDRKLQRINAELVDDTKPKPVQSQASTWHQLQELYVLANQNGLYDAADFIKEHFHTELGNCPHPFVWPNGDCIACDRLATMFPGLTTEHHTVVSRRPKGAPQPK